MPSTHRLDTALRHGVSHRIHYSPRNARKSGSNLKPYSYTRRTSAHRPPSMHLCPRLWPFVFACGPSFSNHNLRKCPHAQCQCNVPWRAPVPPAVAHLRPSSHMPCAVAGPSLARTSLGVAALSRRVPLRLTAPFVVDAVAQDAHTCRTKDVAESVEA